VTPRRTIALLAAVGVAWFGYGYVVPELAEVYVRRELAANGYPDAELQVADLGVGHTQLSGVVIAPGLALGDVGVDVGLSYLWGERAHELRIRHARIEMAAFAERTTTSNQTHRVPKLPAERIQIDDAVVTNGTTQVALTGHAAPATDGTIEVSFEARASERGRPTWTAKGAGTITVARNLEIQDVRGHADLTMPEADVGAIAVTDARVSLGVTRSSHLGKLGPWNLRVTAARAQIAGGELWVDPFEIVPEHPIDVVVHGRGLQLEKLPGRGTIEASGVVDGRVAIRAEGSRIEPIHGELRARAGGRLRLTDPAWRRRMAGSSGGGAAIRERVAGALADLDFSKLTVTLSPPGSQTEVLIALSGRGHHHPQDLHLAVNLRGIRRTLHRFMKPTTPRSPP
jgi:hypothetical protein